MTNSVIGALRVNLGLDSAQFQSGMKEAAATADGAASALRMGFAAAAAAVTAALTAVSVAVVQNLNSFDELSKTSQKLGIPVEELSKLQYAADLSGLSMEGMQTSVSKLSRAMVEASSGTGKMAETFKALGVNVKDASGNLKLPSTVLTELADKFAAMPDGAQKTALAMQLLGKSGADMIPLLNGGSSALNSLLNEAKGFGLEVSTETARTAEAVNDNISRMGFAFSGLGVQLTAALAPALLALTDFGVEIAKTVTDALAYLPQMTEAVMVVGGAFAVAFGPTLIASIGAATVAIGTSLVGAFRALSVAVLANPISAFVAAIGLAVYAVFRFRDEIKNAIGVDVVGVVKDAGNIVINSFVAAFDAISVAWGKLPAVLGDIIYSGANAVIDGVESMINRTISALNGFIEKANTLLPESWQKGTLGTIDLGQIENQYKGATKATADEMAKAVSGAFSVDRIGQFGEFVSKQFKPATEATNQFGQSLAGVNTQLSEIAGGGGGSGKGGKSADGGKIQQVTQNVKGAASEMQRFGQTIASTLSSSFQGLIDGSKKLRDVVYDLLKQLGQMALNSAFQALAGGFGGGVGGGGGGFFGTLLSGIGSIFGFASGGTIMPGGTGGIDSQLVTFRKSPNERVDITKPGQTLTSGRGGVADVRVYVDQDGNWQAAVQRISDERVSAAAPAIVGQANSMVMPTMARHQGQKAGGDYRNG